MDSYFNYTMLTLEYFHWDLFLLTMQLGDFVRSAYDRINHIKCAQLCILSESLFLYMQLNETFFFKTFLGGGLVLEISLV